MGVCQEVPQDDELDLATWVEWVVVAWPVTAHLTQVPTSGENQLLIARDQPNDFFNFHLSGHVIKAGSSTVPYGKPQRKREPDFDLAGLPQVARCA